MCDVRSFDASGQVKMLCVRISVASLATRNLASSPSLGAWHLDEL